MFICICIHTHTHTHTYIYISVICVCVHVHCIRLKALKEPVYSQKEAEAAAGMGNYVLCPPDTMAAFQNTDMEMVEQSTTA